MITGLKPGWRRICLVLSAVSPLLPGWPMGGQQQPTMSVDVRMVNVFAAVRNEHGAIRNCATSTASAIPRISKAAPASSAKSRSPSSRKG